MPPLGIQAQTVFAELVERLQARAATRTVADLSGSFVTVRCGFHG